MRHAAARSCPANPVIHLAVLVLLLAASGCGTFNRDWNRAAAHAASDADIEGAWDGEWRSEVNGHHGRLRCILSRVDAETYRARYKANYWGILRFGYSVTMQREEGPTPAPQFRGSADLGKLAGGTYEYEATITATNFVSTYSSRYDHGLFRLERPQPRP